MRIPFPVSTPWQRGVHDPVYRSRTTRCRNPLLSTDAPRSEPLAALRRRSMQYPGYGVPRISLLGTWVNRGK
jgi:hypothetical protein